MKEKTFEELAKDEVGTIYHDELDEGIRFIVMRGPSALCAYAGIPESHPLAGHHYDLLPVQAHGGLTFGSKAKKDKAWPLGFYWYGWDYEHSGDFSFYYLDDCLKDSLIFHNTNDHKWTVKEVVEDSWGTLYDFKKLLKLAENIVGRKYEITTKV